MNPHSATREQFTVHLTSLPCPEDAHKDYKHLFVSLQKLLDLLAHHEAMRPNLQQTFMTSAASKNKIYFMWDFVGRTLGMLTPLNPKLPNEEASRWSEVFGRASMANMLIKDTTGQLDAMMGGADSGPRVDFGPEIVAASAECAKTDS